MPILKAAGKTVLFIHVPKNAGSAITAMLREFGPLGFDERVKTPLADIRPRHLHGDPLTRLWPEGSFDYSFMVVRHPMARLMSEYRYQNRKSGLSLQRVLPFRQWLRYSLWRARLEPHYRDNHFRPQHQFECHGCQVLRLEDGLHHVLQALSTALGQSATQGGIARINASRPMEIETGPRDVALVAEFYHEDFRRYGYDPAKW